MSASHARATKSPTGLRYGDIEKLEAQLASTKDLLDSIVGRLREVLSSLKTAGETFEQAGAQAGGGAAASGGQKTGAWRAQGHGQAGFAAGAGGFASAASSSKSPHEAWRERMERVRQSTQTARDSRAGASPFGSATRAAGTRMAGSTTFDAEAWRERIRQRVEERMRARKEQERAGFSQDAWRPGASAASFAAHKTQTFRPDEAKSRTEGMSEFERARMARDAKFRQAAADFQARNADFAAQAEARQRAEARRRDMARQKAEAEARARAQAEERARQQAEREAQRLKREQEARQRARQRAEEARARAERERRRRQQQAEESSGMSLPRAFEILSLTFGATKTEVKKAYRSLARTCHPDLGGCEEQMKDLNLAYELAMASSR